MDPDIAFWFPLAFVLVELVEVSCRVIQEDGLGGDVVQHLRCLVVLDGLEKTALFGPVDHLDGLLTDGAEVDKQLHSETASKQSFVCCFAHFKKEFDASILSLPRQHIRVTFDYHDVNQVKSLKEVNVSLAR